MAGISDLVLVIILWLSTCLFESESVKRHTLCGETRAYKGAMKEEHVHNYV